MDSTIKIEKVVLVLVLVLVQYKLLRFSYIVLQPYHDLCLVNSLFHVPCKTKNLLPWIRTQVYLGRITGDRSKTLILAM